MTDEVRDTLAVVGLVSEAGHPVALELQSGGLLPVERESFDELLQALALGWVVAVRCGDSRERVGAGGVHAAAVRLAGSLGVDVEWVELPTLTERMQAGCHAPRRRADD